MGDEVVRSPATGSFFNHAAADGQQRISDQFYLVSGENLMYPRDPRGSRGNIINCRCNSQITFDVDITQLGEEQLARIRTSV